MTHKKRLILGITGGIASGKSSVMALLSKRGIPVICSDDLAHRCIRKGHPAYKKIVRRFGRSILGSDGEINRRTLGKQVFAHPHLRKQLEQIVHPYVIRALKRFAKQHTGVIAMDIPLLLETGLKPLVDQTVVVYATRSQQIQRLLRRNHLSRREALLRIRSQWPLTRKRASADIVILNTRDKGFLRLQIKRFIELLKNRLT